MLSNLKKNIALSLIFSLGPAVSICWYNFCQRKNDADGIKFIALACIGLLTLVALMFLPNTILENENFLWALGTSYTLISLAQLGLINKKILQYYANPTWESYIK